MLAYLALQPGQRAERARLADLLWSDRSEEQARASLRQELSVLRRVLGDAILAADRQAVWLLPGQVQVVAGEGILLDGFDLGSEGFEDWLRDVRLQTTPATPPVQSPQPERSSGRPSLAVMPFDEFSAPEADMFADGVVEEITGALSRVREFDVIARQSAFALRGAALPVPEIAQRLEAAYVVEESVRRSGDRVRIAVQLVRGADGHTVWSERFDDRLDDLFDLQDRIAAQVAGQLSPSLRAAEIAAACGRPPSDRNAYDLTLSALPHFWAHQRSENTRAINLLDQALVHDPDYAPALAYKAWCHAQQHCYLWSVDPDVDRETACALAERAASQAPDHAPTLTAIAAALTMSSTDPDRSGALLDRALEIDPNNAWAWMRLGWHRSFAGNVDGALQAFDRAEALSPLDPFRFNMLFGRGAALYSNTVQHDRALAYIKAALSLNPHAIWANRMLCIANWRAGNQAEARAAYDRLLAVHPDLTVDYIARCVPANPYRVTAEVYLEPFRALGLPEA